MPGSVYAPMQHKQFSHHLERQIRFAHHNFEKCRGRKATLGGFPDVILTPMHFSRKWTSR
jgi:hypothetical protein